jgi:hypothetical protein
MVWGKRVRAIRLATVIVIPAVLSGCAVQTINEKNASELFDKFSTGNMQLATGFPAVGTNIFHVEDMYDAAQSKDWTRLSRIVIEANSGDDVGYYYLGLAAQQLGYKDAARIYFKKSVDDSRRQTLPTQCTIGPQASSYLGRQCHGLVLPQAAYDRLDALR